MAVINLLFSSISKTRCYQMNCQKCINMTNIQIEFCRISGPMKMDNWNRLFYWFRMSSPHSAQVSTCLSAPLKYKVVLSIQYTLNLHTSMVRVPKCVRM